MALSQTVSVFNPLPMYSNQDAEIYKYIPRNDVLNDYFIDVFSIIIYLVIYTSKIQDRIVYYSDRGFLIYRYVMRKKTIR